MARSSTEAEYKAVADATAEFIWIKSLLQELRITLQRSPILWCDNIGATYLAANPVFHAHTKHIEIDYHFVWEQVKLKNLLIGYLSTKDQTADILTKALPKHRFLFLKFKLHLLPILDLRGNVEAYRSPGSNREPVHPTTRFVELSDSRNDRQLSALTWTNQRSCVNRNDRLSFNVQTVFFYLPSCIFYIYIQSCNRKAPNRNFKIFSSSFSISTDLSIFSIFDYQEQKTPSVLTLTFDLDLDFVAVRLWY